MAKVTVYGQIPFQFEMDINDDYLKLDKSRGVYFKEFLEDAQDQVLDEAIKEAFEINCNGNFQEIHINAIQDNQTGGWLYDV